MDASSSSRRSDLIVQERVLIENHLRRQRNPRSASFVPDPFGSPLPSRTRRDGTDADAGSRADVAESASSAGSLSRRAEADKSDGTDHVASGDENASSDGELDSSDRQGTRRKARRARRRRPAREASLQVSEPVAQPGQLEKADEDLLFGVSKRTLKAAAAALLILINCFLNVVTLEFITTRDRSSGNLVTAAQFFAISCIGFIGQWKWPLGGFRARVFPAALFFLLSVINNKAFSYGISMPLHTIFRSASLMVTLTLGALVFKHKYSRLQIFSCLLLTVGVLLATWADAQAKAASSASSTATTSACCGNGASIDARPESAAATAAGADGGDGGAVLGSGGAQQSDVSLWTWLFGVASLTFALVLSAVLGHVQSLAYKLHGDAWEENLFYSHAFPLPFFLLFWSDISAHFQAWQTAPLIPVSWLGLHFELSLTAMLVINVLFQYLCIRGVFLLQNVAGALTCTFVLTLRKFLSLLFSIYYFNNPFTTHHVVGTALVFFGAILYSLPSAKPKRS